MSKSSFRNRVGNAMRRSSSVFTIPRSTTPVASDSDAASINSLKQLDTAPLATPPVAVIPSPIAESPAREAQALEPEPLGPSPLAGGSAAEPAEPTTSEPSAAPPTINEIPPTPQYTAGPGAFTDEPVELPQPAEAPPPAPADPQPESASAPEAAEAVKAEVVAQTAPPAETPSYFDMPAPVAIVPSPDEPNVWADNASASAPTQPSTGGDTINRSVTSKPSASSLYTTSTRAQAQDPPLPQASAKASQVSLVPVPTVPIVDSASARASQVSLVPVPTVPIVDAALQASARASQVSLVPTGQKAVSFRQPSPKPSHLSLAPSVQVMAPSIANPSQVSLVPVAREVAFEADQAKPAAVQSNGDASYAYSAGPDIQMPVEDPFADTGPHAVPVAHEENVRMPKPEPAQELPFSPREGYDEGTPGHILMPLPARHDVMVSNSIRSMPSNYSMRSNAERVERETDERRPLLARPVTTDTGRSAASYLQPNQPEPYSVSPQGGSAAKWAGTAPMLHTLGWIEYVLPDASVYYVHPTHRVVTDVNLRVAKHLEAVGEHLDRMAAVPAGLEVWLKDGGSARRGFAPLMIWVDHRRRVVSFGALPANGEDTASAPGAGEERLDVEYRYWTFVEAHPAHASLPPSARVEAMDVLTWSYTDRLLPTHRPVPPPFTQAECQELMTMLRSFGDNDGSESGIQTVVHTRIVARILLRVATWRQRHFRAHKPLPLDAARSPGRAHPRVPFLRRVSDGLVAALCLGVPLLFAERAHPHRIDEESGLRSTGSMLVVGACACLVAAVVLSASVTFLSLPGLDGVARLAGFVAVLCSAASMAASGVALFRYKADMERAVSHLGGEGLLTLSRRSVVLSLPLVFLAYAVAAFVAGVVLYSLRGAALAEPAYARWAVVGVLGGLAGVLTASAVLGRRG